MSLTGTGLIQVAGPIRQRAPDDRSVISKFIDRVRGLMFRGAANYGFLAGTPGWSDPRWWSENPDDWPAVATEADALGMPPFGRGVELIASTIAGVPFVAYRYDKPTQVDVKLDPQPEVLRDPDPATTPWNWSYATVNDLVLYGNHFAFYGPPNAQGWPRWLEPIDCTQVELGVSREYDGTGPLLVWRIGGETYPYGSIFHVSAGNRSGYLLGRGTLAQYRDPLGGVLDVNRHTGRYFRRGGLPSAVIKVTDPDLKPEQAQGIKDRYMDTIGRGNGREPMVIPGHYEFTPVVSDAEKQQLVEARTWDAKLVAMILGIPAYKLDLPGGSSMTYQNIEQADIDFVRGTVDRWAKPIEAALTKWVLPAGQVVRANWRERTRTDAKTRAEVFALEIQAGVLTVEEARRELDRPPLQDTADTASARELAEMLQKIYLSVGTVITAAEARAIVNSAGGANLPAGVPEELKPRPVPEALEGSNEDTADATEDPTP